MLLEGVSLASDNLVLFSLASKSCLLNSSYCQPQKQFLRLRKQTKEKVEEEGRRKKERKRFGTVHSSSDLNVAISLLLVFVLLLLVFVLLVLGRVEVRGRVRDDVRDGLTLLLFLGYELLFHHRFTFDDLLWLFELRQTLGSFSTKKKKKKKEDSVSEYTTSNPASDLQSYCTSSAFASLTIFLSQQQMTTKTTKKSLQLLQ